MIVATNMPTKKTVKKARTLADAAFRSMQTIFVTPAVWTTSHPGGHFRPPRIAERIFFS